MSVQMLISASVSTPADHNNRAQDLTERSIPFQQHINANNENDSTQISEAETIVTDFLRSSPLDNNCVRSAY